MEENKAACYKDTLNLPQTTLPMRANATIKEVETQKFWDEINIYQKMVENKDKTKQYLIESEKDVDLRKILFKELAKENITIFEMKKADTTLEDAFMKLIEGGN